MSGINNLAICRFRAESVRVRHQSEDREGDGADRAAAAANRGRRDCAV